MNQCDGCRRGLPIDENGNHRGPGGFWAGDVQRCTKDRYAMKPTERESFWKAIRRSARVIDKGRLRN